MKKHKEERIIVISDTHFGDSSQLLDRERTVEDFMVALSDNGRISEIILLGDILDLWVKTTVPAMRKARFFIRKISEIQGLSYITYVPGNHDHQMFLDAFRLEQDLKIMQGDLSTPRFQPARSYGETLLSSLADPRSKVRFSMVYPFIVREIAGKKILFTHGHHLDFYASDFGWFKTFWLGRHIIKKRRKKATLHDIEMANIPFCGAMSMAPWVPELVEEGLKYYHIITFFAKYFHSRRNLESPLRDTLIRENYDEIMGLLPLFECGDVSCFIFGHTHGPGVGRVPNSDLIVANTGSWTSANNDEHPSKTWVEVMGDGSIELYALKGKNAILIESDRI